MTKAKPTSTSSSSVKESSMSNSGHLRVRVKELRTVKASELMPHPKNWRRHSLVQAEALQKMYAAVGMVDPILAIETSKGLMIVDGHLRTGVAGNEEVPVVILDLTPTEAEQVLATLDPITSLAQSDEEALQALVDGLKKTAKSPVLDVLQETEFSKVVIPGMEVAEYDAEGDDDGLGGESGENAGPRLTPLVLELSPRDFKTLNKALEKADLESTPFVIKAARAYLKGEFTL